MAVTIRGAEGWTDEQLLAALDAGGRIVAFHRTFSLGVITLTDRSSPALVMPGESALPHALVPCLLTLLFGWWAIAGIVITPITLIRNLAGGVDLTATVRDAIAAAARARARAAEAPIVDGDELLPDTPEACREFALKALEQKNARAARELLASMLERGPHQDRALLLRLAHELNFSREHASAMEVFEVLKRDFPAEPFSGYTQHLVRASERELGRTTSIVPPPAWYQTSRGFMLIVSSVALAFVLLALGVKEWIRTHRRLYVVNATGEGVTAWIEAGPTGQGRTPTRIDARQRGSFDDLTEGDLVAVVEHADGRVERIAVPLRSTWLDRTTNSVFVVNVDRAGVFLWYQVSYGTAHVTDRPRLHVLEEVVIEHGVTDPFAAPPAELRLKTGEGATRTSFEWLGGRPVRVVAQLPEGTPPECVLDFLELHLRLAPGDLQTRDAYVRQARALGRDDRARVFLAGLPVERGAPVPSGR